MIDTEAIRTRWDLRTLAAGYTQLKKKTALEMAGPCPKCSGTDRFYVQEKFFACRGCHETRGDVIEFMQWAEGLDFKEACDRLGGADLPESDAPRRAPTPAGPEPLGPPCPKWQTRGRAFVAECQETLWSDAGSRALAWLEGRGLDGGHIAAAGLGYNDSDRYDPFDAWGLEPDPDKKGLWLPRGVTIPWEINGDLWRVNIRRPVGKPKYFSLAGFSNGLYLADLVGSAKPVVLVEGEIDALTICQYAGDVTTAAATGSTGGSRLARWIARLALAPVVLVAYDNEPNKGDKAAVYWIDALPNAKRWRPYWSDANQMAQDGADLRAWVLAGLGELGTSAPAETEHAGANTEHPTPSAPAQNNIETTISLADLLNEAEATGPQERPCPVCGGLNWWQRPAEAGGGWVCGRCHPVPVVSVSQDTI